VVVGHGGGRVARVWAAAAGSVDEGIRQPKTLAEFKVSIFVELAP